ncbi:unnamed protein product [Adineta ricciae]|uniref:Protein phosphatase 1 regulatory subunit 16A n=1 Tax=Adineta ricciae TaxID=249248 RepID=A0A815KKE3_ADIRI|nr:unnamed protein product [Adineta ricciae]
MEHSELVQDMTLLEKLTAQERLKHAKRQRQIQLENWMKRENTLENQSITSKISTNGSHKKSRKKKLLVQFPENIVLLEATARQDVDEVRSLLQSRKYSPNTANEDGLTPIHQCSIDNSDAILQLLIEYGGDVNAKDRDLWTPLHAAATCGHMQICKILIENGAELMALNADGNMPYDICEDEPTLTYIETQMDRIGITQEMIDNARAQVENQMLRDLQKLVKKSLSSSRSIDDILSYRNDEGATPLHIASANGYQSVVKYLLDQHVSLNLQDADGWTPVHAAAFWCLQPILTQLIEAGGDIYEKIPDGRTAVDLCEDPEMRNYMIDSQEQCLRKQERAAAAAAAAVAAAVAQTEQQPPTNNLVNNRLQAGINAIPNGIVSRTGTLYESRSSISSPYGSGSSLNRTSSIRRASLRNSERAKKLNESFLDVLQARDKIQEDVDEHIPNAANSNGNASSKTSTREDRSSVSTFANETIVHDQPTKNSTKRTNIPSVLELPLTPVRVPPPLILPQTTADTLSDVKRRREERRRILNGIPGTSSNVSPAANITSPSFLTIDLKDKFSTKVTNGDRFIVTKEPTGNYSSEKFFELHGHVSDENHEKRICCTIL